MSCSERRGRPEEMDRGYRAFLRERGLDDGWTVRFTADRRRALEMAGQYRDAGYPVRVVPLFPEDEAPGAGALERLAGADHDPLREAEADACGPCLADTFVVLTRDAPTSEGVDGADGANGANGLVYR